MTTRIRKHRKTKLKLERLERREVMATFGVPWPEPRNLSVSFPSDNASIGAYPNQLREKLDQVTDRQVWQEEVLRAFQTWAVHANINVGLVADRGDDFGTIGLTTNDPRFGEFRVGAFDQGSTLASASPFGTRNGTWSGDILLNTKTNYFLGDWQSTSPITVPAPNANGPAVELYSVLLHETGNALGLADNNTAGAVMNGLYSGPNGRLKASDIAEIRRLYGARTDPFEPRSNNTLGSSTPITYPAGYRGLTPVSRMGSVNSTADVDVYRFTPLRNQEKVTVRLWAAGISLLKAQLEVLDRKGNKLADVKADSIFNNNLQLEIGSLSDHTLLYIRVAKNSQDVFSVGDYRLELDYRPSNLQPSIVPPVYDADADDNDGGGTVDFVSVDQLFANIGLIDPEV
ncbi:MAG: matrixin family metalloprotease, partial [Pirellulaceae bacterium]|nr:matrixin family metalloprotease [Pirellulaceae bacterium]